MNGIDADKIPFSLFDGNMEAISHFHINMRIRSGFLSI
ncbi:hypothetical protein ATN83_2353 [Raoultella ornithinolytica]|nr:hypothetical protein ATN83_2353 [Raoultella ornithinolytica]KDV97384.1 hypothetical protein AB00_5565 [Raoultella ornithinolytica 2-156-04_S1_C1]KDX07729.1 hypothetical protein AB28_5633 [Raoultella ornithinolytica 2-156-04_S1_C2]